MKRIYTTLVWFSGMHLVIVIGFKFGCDGALCVLIEIHSLTQYLNIAQLVPNLEGFVKGRWSRFLCASLTLI